MIIVKESLVGEKKERFLKLNRDKKQLEVYKRFENLDTLKILSMNGHKQIEMERDFEDASEADINYTSSARDVKNKTFQV